MNWTELLTAEMEQTYAAAEGLLGLVEDDALDWRPPTGGNWMTTGQLLRHLPDACGFCCRCFLTGNWGMPAGEAMEQDDLIPPAAKMPTVASVAEARALLAKDKAQALATVKEAGEERLGSEKVAAPWDPTPYLLGEHFLHMIDHLKQHKGQLFYYLKLQGKPVHTGHLWGLGE